MLTACVALLGASPRLLVVDNCEHLLDAVRGVISALIEGCPELTVLATSREQLGLAAERQCRLAPLALPDLRRGSDLERSPAVTLFIDRVRRVRPGFTPSPAELGIIGEIVRHLDGIPLVIELAAGRLSSLGIADLHARLDRALDLLGDGRSTTAEARHSTLRATIAWSYDPLPDSEQRHFRHLSVFPDGVDLTTAERVAVDVGVVSDPASALAHLVDASMIEAELDLWPRYRMLETLRAFGLDRLAAAQEDSEATERQVRWALDVAAWIETTAVTEREPQADALLRRELVNLRAAWHLTRQTGRLDDAVTLVLALADAASWRDLTEVWGWAHELVDDVVTAAHPRAGAMLGIAAQTSWMRGDLTEADLLVRRGLEAASDEEGQWWCLTSLSLVELSRGAWADAVGHAVEAAALTPRPDQNYGIAALAAT